MSSKSKSYRIRFRNRVYQKVVDFDVPANNSETTSTPSVIETCTESNSGADRPHWRQDIADGYFAGNYVTADRRTVQRQPFVTSSFTTRRKNTTAGWKTYRTEQNDYSQYYNTLAEPGPASHDAAASTQATKEFISKARSRMSPMQMGVTLGELNETIRMLRRPGASLVKRMGSYLTRVKGDLRRNKRESVRKRNEIVANTWLEYSFGWAPLLSDAESLGEAAAKLAVGQPKLRVTGMAGTDAEIPLASGQVAAPAAVSISFDTYERRNTVCYQYGEIKAEFGTPGRFPDSFGLNPHDIIPTIWELVPWSFAIDYFTGIGDFISSITFPESRLLWHMRSRKSFVTRATRNYRPVGNPATSSNALSIETTFSPGMSSVTLEKFTRDVQEILVTPVRFSLPESRFAYANLAALARLRLSK